MPQESSHPRGNQFQGSLCTAKKIVRTLLVSPSFIFNYFDSDSSIRFRTIRVDFCPNTNDLTTIKGLVVPYLWRFENYFTLSRGITIASNCQVFGIAWNV
mmetsp:Transcript_5067/g.9627  ORF Transcript_5067/g.9627 Transcript_5067/m.9627 type:complete len:100 (+) Transcript_5067:93-392(+)